MDYILSAILFIVLIATFAIGMIYFVKARASILYSTVSRVSIAASLYSLLYLINTYYPIASYEIIRSILLALIVYLTFNLWKITYNQISNKTYTVISNLLIVFQLIIDIFVNNNIVFNNILLITCKYSLVYVFVYLITIFKFYKDRHLNKVYEFNFIPFILMIFLLSLLSSLIVISKMDFIFNILQIVSYLLLSLVYYKDYKLSLYF